jgi:SAM-dependent methyltransferase
MEYVIKYDQICKEPPPFLYGGTHIEPLASIGMSHFFYPIWDKFKNNIRVLDYGCGAGILCNYISGQLEDFSYIGLEPDTEHGRERISLAKQYFNDSRCEFGLIEHDLSNALKQKPDVIILISVFTHMVEQDIEIILNNLIKVFEYNPNCEIVFSCFLDTVQHVKEHQPNIWERFYGESYITFDFLKNFCTGNELIISKESEFIAQGNYTHHIIKVKKL